MATRDVVVIGASAGGLSPLKTVLSQMPPDFGAAVFVVLHLAPGHNGSFAQILADCGPLRAKWAEDGEAICTGTVYVAPANRHLVLGRKQVRVLFGPRECRARPSIDVLFRSAAAVHGNAVIGILLSGMLDDGVRGLHLIGRCKGITVVMDPETAEEPELPRNAVREVQPGHVLEPAAIAPLVCKLISQTVEPSAIPPDILLENRVAEGAMVGDATHPGNGDSTITCPSCGGPLTETDSSGYRCRLGHAFGAASLLNDQQDQVEQALWVAMRTIQDRKRVLENLAQDYRKKNFHEWAQSTADRATELEQEYRVLRRVLEDLNNPLAG